MQQRDLQLKVWWKVAQHTSSSALAMARNTSVCALERVEMRCQLFSIN